MATKKQSKKCCISESQIDACYTYWRIRLLYTLIIGYAAFYLVRQNMQIAAPLMLKEFGYSKTQVGWIFSAFPIIYGVGKFVSGIFCDRVNVRYYMAGGLLLAAMTSVFIGFSDNISGFFFHFLHVSASPIFFIAVFYSLNGLFQSAGWPPIARLMTNWFSPKQLGTYWGIVNASHQVGSVTILIGGAWLGQHYGWKTIFFIPAVVCVFFSFFLFNRLCDTPESEGLPPLHVKEGIALGKGEKACSNEDGHASFSEIFFQHILPNRALWLVCWANFFLYVVRMGFFNWAPTFLQEARGSSAIGSSFQTAFFEIFGLFSGIVAGYISDRWAGGRRNAVCSVFMAILIVCLFLFWQSPTDHPACDTILLSIIGFFVYGPQTLAGVAGAEFGSTRAAATANGLTGLFGSLGAIFSGFGVGLITDHFGWNYAILFYIFCATASLFFFMFNWSQTSQRTS
ncbi:MAG: MFS transporter [Puniceicoccales bacterium]|jgi:sugar phosphate permease|nr:MFS transporter [Puniceicoccales bacterium]